MIEKSKKFFTRSQSEEIVMDKEDSQPDSRLKTACQPMYVTFAAVVASLGGILFGYDIGIISGALLQLDQEFNLTCFQQEMIVCAVLLGAFIASFFGGSIVDQWGRKTGIAVSCGLFIAGSLVLSFSVNYPMIMFGRIVVGFAVSLSITSECTYISEISPPNRRGMMVSLNEVGITVGFLLAYFVDYLLISVTGGWKIMFGLAVLPALFQGFGVAFLPKSQHYLLVKGEIDEARRVLRILRNTKDVEEELDATLESIKNQKFSGNANVLYYAPTVFKSFGYHSDSTATLVTVGLGIVKVISTVVTLMIVDKVGRRALLLFGCFFMGTSLMILGIVGASQYSHSTAKSCSPIPIHAHMNFKYNGTVEDLQETYRDMEDNDNFTITKLEELLPENAILIPDSILEKVFNENTTFIAEKSQGIIEVRSNVLQEDKKIIKRLIVKNETVVNDTESESLLDEFTNQDEPSNSLTKIVSVIALMTFVCSYGMSYGPVTWLVLGEIFPGSLRGRAVSLATSINWGSNILVSLTFLDVINAIGVGPTFIIYACVSFAAAIFIFFCVPETKSKTLEEISKILTKRLIRSDIKCCRSNQNVSEDNKSSGKSNHTSERPAKQTRLERTQNTRL
ncbi:solute carrier family 2, facilitated glucose transporter member 10-like isoform X2 [Uloborus diversus]|uniref:solute carrier family 2, facilitated glucose transporter member 10-like isoform X2 n=1 Tax=Uloborus diversus TaxID=327109 RepID=UPI0024090FE9|nr:solute carrier family 2, facilitated glucose transporter member 10-like isoform X2 [Uloborus diversus]